MDSLLVYNNELLKKRGWISQIPKSKKAVMLFSGGYDSTITAARLIQDFGMELYPIYFERGARNKEGELRSVAYYTQYLRQRYGKDKFHDVLIPEINIPPKEIKDRLQDYANTHCYPMRDFIMEMLAVQYAASISEEVRTICNGVIANDYEASLIINRINTLAICEMTKENDWNILSINIDTQISPKIFSKHDEIKWAEQNNFDDTHTLTCWTPIIQGNEIYHCGECEACRERQNEFKIAQVVDKTKYFTKEK